MSTEHRKPLVAFVVLALAAAVLVGVHRAEAQAGRMFAAVVGATVRAQGTVAAAPGLSLPDELRQASVLGPVFTSLREMTAEPGPRRFSLVVFESETVRRTGAAGSATVGTTPAVAADRSKAANRSKAADQSKPANRSKPADRSKAADRETPREAKAGQRGSRVAAEVKRATPAGLAGKQKPRAARAGDRNAVTARTGQRYAVAAATRPFIRRPDASSARAHATNRRVRNPQHRPWRTRAVHRRPARGHR